MVDKTAPATPPVAPAWNERLDPDHEIYSMFTRNDCPKALQGQSLPMNLGNTVLRLCVVHGIRHHVAFARSAEVAELCAVQGQEVFARARNASLIMSDEIPSSMTEETYPYCIWHPRLAAEETYRELVRRYPNLRYHVGRACAVSGYSKLYHELDLLPDTSIAEEARETRDNPGSQEIFKDIMAAPCRFRVMDDYTRTVNLTNPHSPACLNADTMVRHRLQERYRAKPYFGNWTYEQFDIEEDQMIGEKNKRPGESLELSDEEADLLVLPLPFDLPTMKKDLLILVAAYKGNVDRYVRLRRPRMIRTEIDCLVRGIYHSTFMANWVARDFDNIPILGDRTKSVVRRAINARRVMDGVTSHLLDNNDVPDDELPYWIWWPETPGCREILSLARGRPAMRPQCARACIHKGWKDAYTTIMDMPDMEPDCFLLTEAGWQKDPFFKEDFLRREKERGEPYGHKPTEEWKFMVPGHMIDDREGEFPFLGRLYDNDEEIKTHQGLGAMYEHFEATIRPIEFYISAPESMRIKARQIAEKWEKEREKREKERRKEGGVDSSSSSDVQSVTGFLTGSDTDDAAEWSE